MPIHPRRVFVPITSHPADANTLFHYPAEKAAWIWHPEKGATDTCVLRFRLKFTLKEAASPLLHVTADQRFQLRCDGEDVTFGPDRCDLPHWTVQTVQIDLAPGEHELEAVAWFITEFDGTTGDLEGSTTPRPPMAQMSWRGGFLLYGEGIDPALLTTGQASWMVEDVSDAVQMVRPQMPYYLDVGPTFTFDLDKWAEHKAKPAVVIMPPLTPTIHGVRRPGWALFPAELPEQQRESWRSGRIRAYRASVKDDPYQASETKAGEIPAWQELITKGKALTVPARTECTVLWDFETYCCGYPITETEGGKGAKISWNWAEGLFEAPSIDKIVSQTGKGNRGEIVGKVFFGLEDGWIIGSSAKAKTPSLWWRCGRYVQLRVKTADAPLTITGLSMLTTGAPLDPTASWKSSDESWDKLIPLFVRAYQIAGHETWTDTPYYEQMCYVGDNLLNAVSNYAWFKDARLSRRSIELYEWSRRATGMVAERYPSGWRQEASTFSLYWPVMVRDYAWWRDDVAFTKSMLPGLRSVISEFDALVQEDGLLHHVPGWPFVDWVPGWREACGPGVRTGDSSIINLIWVMALNAAAQVEDAYGDPLYAQRHREVARKTMEKIVARYWDAKRGVFLDTPGEATVSEHAQMFALLTGLLDADKTKSCLAAMRKGLDRMATIFAAYYVLEALYCHGETEEFYKRLKYWRGLPAMGFTATPETPEPSRSDSHPWGAHPLYHTAASIAGVRPAGPAFSKVRIAPMPGAIEHFEAKVVHPKGFVEVAYKRSGGKSNFILTLPEGVSGEFVFNGKTSSLKPGKTEINA